MKVLRSSIALLLLNLGIYSSADALPIHLTGSFGASVFEEMPTLNSPWSSGRTLPANYVLSISAQSPIASSGVFLFTALDRCWSGSKGTFSSSAYVLSGGIGYSVPIELSRIEFFVGGARYSDVYDIVAYNTVPYEVASISYATLVGTQLVLRVAGNISATARYRLFMRDGVVVEGVTEHGGVMAIETSPYDHSISFGLGFQFGK